MEDNFSYKTFLTRFAIFWLVLANLDILSLIFYSKAENTLEIISIYFSFFGVIAIPYLILKYKNIKTFLPLLLISFLTYGFARRGVDSYKRMMDWLSNLFGFQVNHPIFLMVIFALSTIVSLIFMFYRYRNEKKLDLKSILLFIILPISILVTYVEYNYLVVNGINSVYKQKKQWHDLIMSKEVNMLEICSDNYKKMYCIKNEKRSTAYNTINTESVINNVNAIQEKLVAPNKKVNDGFVSELHDSNFFYHKDNQDLGITSIKALNDDIYIVSEDITADYKKFRSLFLWFNNFFLFMWLFITPLSLMVHQIKKGKLYGFFKKQ